MTEKAGLVRVPAFFYSEQEYVSGLALRAGLYLASLDGTSLPPSVTIPSAENARFL